MNIYIDKYNSSGETGIESFWNKGIEGSSVARANLYKEDFPSLKARSLSVTKSYDLIVRIKGESGDYKIFTDWTRNVTQPIQSLIFENSVLKYVTNNLWRGHKYSQEYAQLLLGVYTQEEFLAIAQNYAIQFKQVESPTLLKAASIIINTLGENLTSGDLSQILAVDPNEIERALESSPLLKIGEQADEEPDEEHG
ncbi:MAG: hypothetical protein ISS64_08835 [Desulfobacterales bacterium]|nr:hypothetical protein [Desulfobacterales bacterium]